jgi:hypothetical protein
MAVDTSVYERQRRSVNDRASTDLAQNGYAQFLSQQRGNRQAADFKQDFGRSQPGFTSSWAKRGMAGGGVRSGAFQQALQNRVGDYTQGLGRMQQDQAVNNRQYEMNGASIEAYRQQALADLEAQKSAQIAQAALNLQALKPYF